MGPSLGVLVFGDWGTGGPGQRKMSRSMEEAHGDDPPAMVLTVGDNFYPDGVWDVDDPLLLRVFERVYRGPFWDSLPFYPTLGNHDRFGDPGAQIRSMGSWRTFPSRISGCMKTWQGYTSPLGKMFR